MTTVPKLNYANLRGKSKSKDNDNQPKMQNSSNELFQHMNQDNIKYIHSQIKQKQRKSNQIKLKRKSEEDVEISETNKYPEEISEKQSRYQETQRGGGTNLQVPDMPIKVMKTDGESIRSISAHEREIGPSKKVSEQAQTHKLSYYDLVSQAKSKRMPSIEGAYQQDQTNHKNTGQFLNFLTGYIDDLSGVKNEKNRFSKIKNKNQMQKTRNKDKQRQKINSITISSASQVDILKNCIAEQKMHNHYLAKQIEQHRQEKKDYQKRMNRLEQFVTKLAEQVQILHEKLQKKPALQKSQIENMNIYDHRIELNSHRKNHTSFSMFTNDYNKQPHHSRKIYHEQLSELEHEYELFKQTGECKIRRSRRGDYID